MIGGFDNGAFGRHGLNRRKMSGNSIHGRPGKIAHRKGFQLPLDPFTSQERRPLSRRATSCRLVVGLPRLQDLVGDGLDVNGQLTLVAFFRHFRKCPHKQLNQQRFLPFCQHVRTHRGNVGRGEE